MIITGSFDHDSKIWDVRTGQCVHTLSGHRGEVSSTQFNFAGTLCVSGSIDCTCRLWDIRCSLSQMPLPSPSPFLLVHLSLVPVFFDSLAPPPAVRTGISTGRGQGCCRLQIRRITKHLETDKGGGKVRKGKVLGWEGNSTGEGGR